MQDKDIKQTLENLIWSILGGILSYIVNFFLTPYIVKKCGIEAYGFVSLGNTLTSYINIIAVGINSFAARFIAIHYHKKEYKDANAVYSSVLIANIFLSIAVLIISIPLLVGLDNILEIPDGIIFDVKLLFLLIIFNYILNLFIGVVNTIAFINNKTGITAKIKVSSAIMYVLISIFLFGMIGAKIYYVGIAILVSSFVYFTFSIVWSNKIDKNIQFSFKSWSVSKVKEVVSAGIFNSINSLGGTLGSGLDLLITNKLLSNLAMGQISIGNQLGTLSTTTVSLVSGVFQPKQLEAYSKGDTNSLTKQLIISMKICGFIGGAFLAVFALLGHPFLALWLPEQQTDMIFYLTLIILIGDAIVSITTPLYYVMTLTLKMQIVCIITIICGLTNVVSMIVLITNRIGTGQFIVVGTTAVLDLVALFIFPRLSKKYLNLPSNPFWKVILMYLFVISVSSSIGVIFSKFINAENWMELIAIAILCGVIVTITYFMAMFTREEKNKIKEFISKK